MRKREEKGDERGRKEIRKRFRDMEEIEAIERQRHWRATVHSQGLSLDAHL